MHREVFDPTEQLVTESSHLFTFPLVRYTREVEESKKLNALHTPAVIIAASGMAESGRILHHLAHGAPDPRNTILIVGFQAEHTLGRRIVERQPEIRIFGEDVPLRAEVQVLNGYSAHADRDEMVRWLAATTNAARGRPAVTLVHGEPEVQDDFATTLRGFGYTTTTPALGDSVRI